jgi:hypothetical protein
LDLDILKSEKESVLAATAQAFPSEVGIRIRNEFKMVRITKRVDSKSAQIPIVSSSRC